MTAKPFFRVGVAGLDPRDWRLIEIVFKHSQYNRFEFRLVQSCAPDAVDVLIVNSVEPEGLNTLAQIRSAGRNIPVISAVPRGAPNASRYAISIDRLTLQLLPILNRVVEVEILSPATRPMDAAPGTRTTALPTPAGPAPADASAGTPGTPRGSATSGVPPGSPRPPDPTRHTPGSSTGRVAGAPGPTSVPVASAGTPPGAPGTTGGPVGPRAPTGPATARPAGMPAGPGRPAAPGASTPSNPAGAAAGQGVPTAPGAGTAQRPTAGGAATGPGGGDRARASVPGGHPAAAPSTGSAGSTAEAQPARGVPSQAGPSTAPAGRPGAGLRSAAGRGASNLVAFPGGAQVGMQRLRVMVVDDSPTVRQQLGAAFERMGVICEAVASAADAIERLDDQHYDLVLVDVVMPEMDGYRLTREIKKSKRHRSVPVIILTSRSSPFDLARGALAGCDTYLTKPVPLRALEAAVVKQLRKALAIDDLSGLIRTSSDATGPRRPGSEGDTRPFPGPQSRNVQR